jgi:hypothetical protein
LIKWFFIFCFFASIKNRLLTPFYILYKSFPISQESAYKRTKSGPYTAFVHPACPLFKAFFTHLLAAAHPTTTTTKKEIDSQPTPPNPPPACPTGPKPLQSTELYYLYTIFCSYSAKSFQRFRVNTYNLFDLSFKKLPLFFCPGSLKIKSALFSRDLI